MKAMGMIEVKKLKLDLNNYRFTPQENEIAEINSMISLNQDRFWSLMESIIESGYLPGENIIVLEDDGKYLVKEGNRRIAALKLILGQIREIEIPDYLVAQIKAIDKKWKDENAKTPCTIYTISELDYVKKVVALIHATGEKAARDKWTSIARARYSRDEKNQPDPVLDLLEYYLKDARNLDSTNREKWSGDYPLTVLKEAIQKLAPVFPNKKFEEIVKLYPAKYKMKFEALLFDVGSGILTFNKIRASTPYFGEKYGFVIEKENTQQEKPIDIERRATAVEDPDNDAQDTSDTQTQGSEPRGKNSYPLNDPRSVRSMLRQFHPSGLNRDKLLVVLSEIRKLKVDEFPIAFCFLLRSMFEISAKIFCQEHQASSGPKCVDNNGGERKLVDVLKSITAFLTQNGKNKEMEKILHGAITELARPEGLLSVTSMNQLVHNPNFMIASNDICILFHSVFPLLDLMNRGI